VAVTQNEVVYLMPNTVRLVEKRMDSWGGRMLDAIRSYTVGPMSLKDPALAAFFGNGRQTSSGVVVSDAMAFTFSAVYSAVDQISSDIAKVPLNLRKWRQTGGSDVYTDSKLYRILHDEPNPEMSSFEFRRTLMAHALTCKGGFAEIERDGAGKVAALWILTPNRVTPFLEKSELQNGRYRSHLRYRIDGGPTVLDAKDVLHIHGLGYDGYSGYPLIDIARQAIGLALAAERFGATFFGNGATFGGVLSTDGSLSDEAKKSLRKSIEAYYSSADKAHRLLIVDGGLKYNQTGTAPNEAQMNELRDKQVEEVARFFNMPLHKLKLNKPGAVSYSSVEMADLDYVKGCLLNWYVNCEQEYNRKLIPSLERTQQFVKHNLNSFMRADSAARSAYYNVMANLGVFCADDILELEDMNPQPNGQGKIFLVQGAMVPKDRLAAVVDSQIKKNTTPKPAPTSPQQDPTLDPNAGPKRDALIESLMTRAAAAEQVAAEARTATALAEERHAAVLASHGSLLEDVQQAAADVASARAAEAAATLLVAECQAEAESLRESAAAQAVEMERVTTERAQVAEQLAAVRAEAEARRLELVDAVANLATLREGLEQAQGEATRGAEALAQANSRLEVTEQQRLELAAALEISQEERLAVTERHDAALVAAKAAEEARVVAEQASTSAGGALEEARATADRCVAEVQRISADRTADQAARMAAERAQAEAEAAVVVATEARQAASHAAEAAIQGEQARVSERDALAERLREAERQLQEAVTAAADAEAARAAALAAQDALQAQAVASESQMADLNSKFSAAQAEATSRQAAVDSLSARLEGAEQAAAELRTGHEEATRAIRSQADIRHAELALQLEQQSARAAAIEREMASLREADAHGVAGVIAAHRELVIDTMTRAIERETSRLQRAQATPEKLRAAVDGFYDSFTDHLREVLRPAVKVHLAFVRSQLDPDAEARRLAEGHTRESRRQLARLLDEDPDAFNGVATAMWHRWVSERSAAIADVLMQAELDYVRRR
jgi:HK97 family phage portal protein